jgi:hypothetical protein
MAGQLRRVDRRQSHALAAGVDCVAVDDIDRGRCTHHQGGSYDHPLGPLSCATPQKTAFENGLFIAKGHAGHLKRQLKQRKILVARQALSSLEVLNSGVRDARAPGKLVPRHAYTRPGCSACLGREHLNGQRRAAGRRWRTSLPLQPLLGKLPDSFGAAELVRMMRAPCVDRGGLIRRQPHMNANRARGRSATSFSGMIYCTHQELIVSKKRAERKRLTSPRL